MLGIQKAKHLASQLGCSEDEVRECARHPADFVQAYDLFNPEKPNKVREVIDVRGKLRLLQSRLMSRVFKPVFCPSDFSHGGISGRSIKTNAEVHRASRFAFNLDVTNFYPSISIQRVNRFFLIKCQCSPDVSSILTKLVTHNYHLALGLLTSPLLADAMFTPIDCRLAAICASRNLKYSRFVDDITVSGMHPFDDSGVAVRNLISQAIAECGFRVHKNKKAECGALASEDVLVTKLAVKRGKIHVSSAFVERLAANISDARRLERNEYPTGLYYSESAMIGKARFALWLDKQLGVRLLRDIRRINWQLVRKHAEQMKILVAKKKLTKKVLSVSAT